MAHGTEETVLGRVTAVFGVKGWLKVHSFTDPVENILDYSRWVLVHNGKRESATIIDSKRHGRGLVVLLKGVDDRNRAQEYCGAEIVVSSTELPDLPEGEYYWHQLEGLTVLTDEGHCFGRVDHLIETGSNDVLVVRPTDQSIDDRERLIPYLPDQVVTVIDLAGGSMTVVWDPEF